MWHCFHSFRIIFRQSKKRQTIKKILNVHLSCSFNAILIFVVRKRWWIWNDNNEWRANIFFSKKSHSFVSSLLVDSIVRFWIQCFTFFPLPPLWSLACIYDWCDTELNSAYVAQNVLKSGEKRSERKNGWFIYCRIYLDKWAVAAAASEEKKYESINIKNKEISMDDVCVFRRFLRSKTWCDTMQITSSV